MSRPIVKKLTFKKYLIFLDKYGIIYMSEGKRDWKNQSNRPIERKQPRKFQEVRNEGLMPRGQSNILKYLLGLETIFQVGELK